MATKVTDEEFIAAWKRLGSPEAVSRAIGLKIRAVYTRRETIEQRLGVRLDTTGPRAIRPKAHVTKVGSRIIETAKGAVVVFSDLHIWPGERPKTFDALLAVIKMVKPSMIVCNGDAFDGARISRHPPTGWQDCPTVVDELTAVQEFLSEIEAAAPKKCKLIWPLGNHDSRFTNTLAQNAPEYVNVKGMDITDHFPAWNFAWDLHLNDNTVIKHRNAGGVHAAYNNVLKGGKTIVTGHTHRLQVVQYADYNGLRYGVECGTMSDFGPETTKFAYTEGNPLNWSQGFVVLTYDDQHRLLEPEICRAAHGRVYFRGVAVA